MSIMGWSQVFIGRASFPNKRRKWLIETYFPLNKDAVCFLLCIQRKGYFPLNRVGNLKKNFLWYFVDIRPDSEGRQAARAFKYKAILAQVWMPVSKGMPLELFGGQYSNYRWCEQEMEILCGLKVPQRPCRHLFIHRPVSALLVHSWLIGEYDKEACYIWCDVMSGV